MLLITKREEIGTVCGHSVHTITRTEMIQIPNSSVLSNSALSKDEKRSSVCSDCKYDKSVNL